MKRKRGRKPGPKNALRTAVANDLPTSPASLSPEDKGSVDHTDNTPVSSEVVPEPTLSTPEKPSAASNNPADVPYVKPKVGAVYGRVKVKLKPSRVLEPHQSSSDVQTPKEVDKSDNKVPEEITETALEKDAVSSDMQTSELKGSDSDPTARKVGSIKIKSRGLSSIHDTTQDRCASTVEDPLPSKQESVLQIKESKDLLELKNLSEEKAKQLPPEHRHDETELTVALEVIKKVMKMDAAEPFNTPVDPVALGIPDYFDIIDTPMDFGTICHDLEHGNKYMNSEDVYKDVHYIWDNCTKYNSKGDYIIELMKRVKKAFMKNWLAAGLYSDIPDTGANENTNNEDALLDIQEKNHPKSKSKNKRRRQGIDRHKNDCLCAVCVVTRRRKERDENSVANENETVATNSNISEQHNMEEKTLVNNPASHDATSGGEQSPRADVYKERGEGERNKRVEMPGQLEIVLPIAADSIVNKVEDPEKCVNNQPTDLLLLDNQNEGSSQNSEEEDAGYKDPDKQERHTSTHPNGDSTSVHHQQEAPTGTRQDVKMQDYPIEQNHLVLQLCTNLFPVNQSSIFRGPHSLFHFHRHAPSQRRSPIHAAMAMIMKP